MWSVATAWQLGASVFFCILFFEDQHFVSGFVPRLLLRGIRFLVEVAAEMCVTEFGTLCAAVSLILPVPRGEENAQCRQHQSGKRKVCQAMVQLGPAHIHTRHTNTHVAFVMDTKDELNYPPCNWTQGQQLLNALHPLSKQTPWTVHSSFQSDWQIRMTVSSTPRCPILSSQRLSVTERLLRAQR